MILEHRTIAVALARLLSHLGFLDHLEGRPAEARAIFERGLALAVETGDRHRVAEFMDNLGNMYAAQNELEQATRMFEEAIGIWRELDQGHWLAMALNNLGKVQIRRGQLDRARAAICSKRSAWRSVWAIDDGLPSPLSPPPRWRLPKVTRMGGQDADDRDGDHRRDGCLESVAVCSDRLRQLHGPCADRHVFRAGGGGQPGATGAAAAAFTR